MWGIEMNSNDSETKGLAQLNPHQKESRDRVGGGDGQGIPEEDEWRISENGENVNGGFIELVQAEAVPRRQQQQPQRTVVQWDQFLPLRSLKVLLVENNDSTRHVVGALLRNCGYEVVAVTNGIEAWKILEDRTDHIDLVLTEVVMPCLSGVGLLSKIKRHTISKHIPVIMMSSNDSMGTVINCLSKGAVDFLVKPIRKNEIKNLWQHVWRKCRSSSGSESGTRTQNPTISKGVEGLENNTSCNNENDNGSVGLNFKDESDNGSATQSSWSKRVVEVDWHQQMSVSDQLADRLVSTCAQVIHSRPEAISSNWVPKSATRECCRENELDCVAMGKDLEIGIPRSPDLQLEDPSKKVLKSVIDTNTDNFFDLHSKNGGKELEKERLELDSETVNGKRRKKAANFTLDDITNCTNHQMESVADEVPNDPSKISDTEDRAINVTNELSSLELRLKRQRVEEDATIGTLERNVLRHSDLSAFTRYNASIDNQDPAGNIGSCYPLYNNSEAANGKLIHNLQFKLHTTPNPNRCSNVSSSKDNMGSTSDYIFNKPEASNEMPIPASTVKADRPDTTTGNTVSAQAKAMHQQVQVQHHHHYYHHHHHHVHNAPKQQEPSNHEDLSLRNTVASASNCRPSDVLTGLSEGNAANYTSYSLSGSGSGSINRSNGEDGSRGQNGSSSSAAMAGGVNTVRNDGVGGNCGGEDGSGSGSRSGGGVDQNRLAQREAALYKFRQKRRDRCFDKKVRYQNRKRVAEQRPRVRGQFARQFHFS